MTTVVAVRQPAGGRLGDPSPGPPQRIPLTGTVLVGPRSVAGDVPGGEPLRDRARDGMLEELTLYSDNPGEDVTHLDELEVDGTLYDIDSPPARWPGAGIVIQISRAVG